MHLVCQSIMSYAKTWQILQHLSPVLREGSKPSQAFVLVLFGGVGDLFNTESQ